MMKCMVMLASAVVGMQVYAATYTFPPTGTDIAADWGEGNKPGSSDVAKFVTPMTLTTSENVTFGKIELTPAAPNKSFTFDLRNTGKTVEVTQTGTTPSFAFGLRSTTAYLKGGIWNSSGSGYFTAGGKSLCSVIFSDAATLTVAGTLVPGYNSSDDNSVVLAGCTTATVGTVVLGRSNVTGARLEVARANFQCNSTDFCVSA